MPELDYQALCKDIQELKEEQQRLRTEQERLRRETENWNGHRSGDGNTKKQTADPSSHEAGDEGGGRQEAGQKTSNDENKEQNKEQNKQQEQPKPPLKERVRTYVQTHRQQVLFGAMGFVVLCVAAVSLLLYLRSYESTDDAQVDGHLNAISPRVMGTVRQVYFEDDQMVTAGQLLVELDPNDFQTALEQAKGSYAAAEAQLKAENPNVPIIRTSNESAIATGNDEVQTAQAAVIAAEQEYQSRLASLRQAEANDAKAQLDLIRYRGLVEKDEVSHEQFDTIVAAAKTQSAGVAAMQAAAEAAKKSIDQSRAQLLQAQARLNETTKNAPRSVIVQQATVQAREAALLSAKAQADQAALNLSYTKIFAPVSGIIADKSVEVGQQIEPGEQLCIISQIEDIWITANFKETQLKKMHAGQPVDIHVDTYGKKYHGYIENMPGATGARTSLLPPENATGNFVKVVQRLPVRIRLNQGEDKEHLLRPGMSVEPKVWLK